MLPLRSISLFQYKNYAAREFIFEKRVVAICGKNGIGKTNLLDAIYYLCFTRSYFTRQDGQVTQQGKEGFRLEGTWDPGGKPEKAVCVVRETGRKEFSVNGQPYEKFSQHIGRYPCVVIAPDDAALITGDSRERRTFLDALLCQLDADYLQDLIRYKKILEQRNALLKSFADKRMVQHALLDVLDEQLAAPAARIYARRSRFLEDFIPQVQKEYVLIARQPEPLTVRYQSDLQSAGMEEWLRNNRTRDCQLQRTQSGVHRDDLQMELGGRLFRNTASQGQRKSLLFALKLAEMDALTRVKGSPPLLLLDDVFEKLDAERMSNLLEKVCVENTGQVFITDTHEERLCTHLREHRVDFQLIQLRGVLPA